MKLWRKLAKKDPVTGKRDGRDIAYQLRMSEIMGKTQPKTYPLLEALFKKMGLRYVLTAKQVEALKAIKEKNGENTNEVE